MTCPWCGAQLADGDAIFCSRCGRRLGSDAGEVTEKIEEPGARTDDLGRAPSRADEPTSEASGKSSAEHAQATGARTDDDHTETSPSEHEPKTKAGATAAELWVAVRRALKSGRWPEATSAAAIGFLAVLGVGALFVAVVKLFDPTLGVGRSPLWVLTRVVIAGLASLGIPVEQAGLGGSILPMGALALIAWAMVWAARTVVARGDASTSKERLIEGLKMAPPFALMCCIAALLFRVRTGLDFGADPGLALVLGGFWGALFGAVGGLLAGGSLGGGLRSLRPSSDGTTIFEEGYFAAATMLVVAAVLAFGVALIFLIIELTTGARVPLTAGDAIAIIFLLLAFAPNIALGTLAFSLGAPISFMAETFGAGFRVDYSLFGWNGVGPDWYVYFALFIPLVACLFGGFSARHRTRDPGRAFEVIGIAASLFAVVLSLLVYISALSIDRGFLGRGNLLVLGPDAAAVFFLALVWAGAVGALGWRIADSQPDSARPPESTQNVEQA